MACVHRPGHRYATTSNRELDEIPTDAHGVIERLVDARLLVRDRHSTPSGTTVVVEVAHEALLRQWPTLKGWLAEDAVALKVAEALGRAADEWLTNNRGTEWLVHTGERLETAETLRQRPDFERLMGESGRDYLAACRAETINPSISARRSWRASKPNRLPANDCEDE